MPDYWETYKKRLEASRPPFERMVDEDIKRCSDFLESDFDETQGKEFHLELTSKYNDHIWNFGNSLYGYYYEGNFFNLEYIGIESLNHNITSIKYKLIAFKNNGYKNAAHPKSSNIC